MKFILIFFKFKTSLLVNKTSRKSYYIKFFNSGSKSKLYISQLSYVQKATKSNKRQLISPLRAEGGERF